MSDALREIIQRCPADEAIEIPSVSSARPDVLQVTLPPTERLDRQAVIEANSNQVSQDHGYSGMPPADLTAVLNTVADENGTDLARQVVGGGHHDPLVWRHEEAKPTMANADMMVPASASAGATDLHLNCSEGCTGGPAPLTGDMASKIGGLVVQPGMELSPTAIHPPPRRVSAQKQVSLVPYRLKETA